MKNFSIYSLIDKCKVLFLLCICVFIKSQLSAQTIISGEPVFEENFRRNQLIGNDSMRNSLMIRPIYQPKKKKNYLSLSPVLLMTEFNSRRPYGRGNYLLKPNVGIQSLISFGFEGQVGLLHVRFRPEFTYSENKEYDGYPDRFSNGANVSKFHFWNNGDYPERFADEAYTQSWYGQSSITLRVGPIEAGISTENIWWGPGQWSDLTFSSNSKGFPHLSLNSFRPIKTFLGNFEAQIIVGTLYDSGRPPSQNENLNARYFEEFPGDDRYLNALMISYNPKWIPDLYIGVARTFQRYESYQGNTFNDYFPIFQAFQKERFFENGNSVDFDNDGYDQQLTLNLRYLVPSANFEIYGEYGRRDHAFNYREFILNPDHARAYLFGMVKLFPTKNSNSLIQVRSEILHQQSSNNRYIRYPGLLGGFAWNTHDQARGFSNDGESLGTGYIFGTNVQTLELAKVEGLNKKGVLFERVANQQDFYFAAFGRSNEVKPWVDLSLGLLWDQQFDRFIMGGKAQFIRSYNYQWQPGEDTTPNFPTGKKIFSFYGNVNLIYQFNN